MIARNHLLILVGMTLGTLFMGGCAERSSVAVAVLPPGGDADVTIIGNNAEIEIRNMGDTIADLKIEAHRGLSQERINSPQLPLPPNARWKLDLAGASIAESGAAGEKGVELWIHNQGDSSASLVMWTPRWTTLRVDLHYQGRDAGPNTTIIDEPGADGKKRSIQ